ncbi:hypothetical protein A2686_03945 [Candidatus Woesebacteria bacterium RIFCSPHIGHO2_01_FULL_38_10]|uniref:Urease accessory protein UreH-like transmembrane domain-containing protein n=1 Tax=Candidatus Woesebacteria bacterium RIFCSPLOWO2_01_FULL_39_10b TaxID=1802517 RepID=A0A1F8B8H8_9BACT|nr:MAG: hypothetical protein A2686_03945 [Candidatus Woesebacteria bacterium RIFCSPHIGHO2_01_FULL_38_10]OGM59999.1 MAG: hypothetical protein A2892_03830 [Candidatus Woesebacteria bacterium RIFCSPLOWO2_01_FULL_39_10b]
MDTVWLALITGLTTGGISCFAVQGGLLASSLTNQKDNNQKLVITSFLASKLIAYSLLGAFLGLLGSSLVISPKLQGLLQIFAGIFMLATVGKLLDIHPIFRHFVITPPKVAYRLIRLRSRNEGFFGSAILGFLTVFIPCGVTQAMMLLSISTGSPVWGSLTLGAFTLGTSPVFFALGAASNQILQRKSLKYLAASAIFVLATLSINTGQILRGSVHTLQNYWAVATDQLGKEKSSSGQVASVSAKGVQEAEIRVLSNGYQSSVKTIKAGIPVSLKLTTQNTKGCSRAFTIPEYEITQILPETGIKIVEFTPTRRGRLTYSCSMGMYAGYFEVI